MFDMKIYDEGWRARLCGDAISTNPYPDGTAYHTQWFSAWCDIDQHLNDRDAAFAYTFGHTQA